MKKRELFVKAACSEMYTDLGGRGWGSFSKEIMDEGSIVLVPIFGFYFIFINKFSEISF